MKLLSAQQIRELDQYTIEHEPIASIELMERAASKCTEYLIQQFNGKRFTIVAGTGNNGGDGLAIARQLDELDQTCSVILAGRISSGSPDFRTNLERLKLHPKIKFTHIQEGGQLPERTECDVLVDALFGTGLSRPADGEYADLIHWMNEQTAIRVSIDIPSGMFADLTKQENNAIVHADHTLSFQIPKIPFLFDEHRSAAGRVHILDIGLDRTFHDSTNSEQFFRTAQMIKELRRARKMFSHKQDYGHVLLVAGSEDKMGAALLCASASLHGGAGLLSCRIPSSGVVQLNARIPEAMIIPDPNPNHLSEAPEIRQNVVVIGPGLGLHPDTKKVMRSVFEQSNLQFVIDADALNALAEEESWWELIKGRAILTPHPGEFERLANCGRNQVDQYNALKKLAVEKEVVIVLKGPFSRIALPNGSTYFNSTGNPGMATAGSGDVLAGLCGGILASGYKLSEAALLGTFIHGRSGDICADLFSQEAITASMIAENIGVAWKSLD